VIEVAEPADVGECVTADEQQVETGIGGRTRREAGVLARLGRGLPGHHGRHGIGSPRDVRLGQAGLLLVDEQDPVEEAIELPLDAP
jgi:hypothetical protein